ncbi:hypothetical protein HRE53_27955 (plasmid) [Acaryochloris sp. 'Moss Beach']|uniref:hypothetical protein n=1 Tax=Acaryochloris TaxID=155977 RepID=UPI001BB0C25F|nr:MULTISPECIES: hypothetical protein [Acaryochloris]QUY45994.1 hypothetical protein I1H34_30175 [Acaryochloris marina S15]UJB72658.1 hypothetical protein HRE53_27955 [Acaryochloris sp. 'Moss Beach']
MPRYPLNVFRRHPSVVHPGQSCTPKLWVLKPSNPTRAKVCLNIRSAEFTLSIGMSMNGRR